MSYESIGGATFLQLRPEAHAERIVFNRSLAGKVAFGRDLGPLCITDADTWEGIPDQLNEDFLGQGEFVEDVEDPRHERLMPSAEELERQGLEADRADLTKPSKLSYIRLGNSSSRHLHGTVPLAIGIDLTAVETAVVNKVGRLEDDPKHAPIWARVLDQAMREGIREAALVHNLQRSPVEIRRAVPLTLLQAAVSYASVPFSERFGLAAGLMTFAAGAVAQNGVRAYLAARDGDRLADFCWSFLATYHLDRAYAHLPIPKRLVAVRR